MNHPSTETWKRLYDAALSFRATECWSWLYDADLFGVRDPIGGEIHYCCVMGRLGEMYGLAAYPGTEGLTTYLALRERELDDDGLEAARNQRCLLLSFEEDRDLDKHDRSVVAKLGLKLTGDHPWSQFRSYEPGLVPRHITAEQAEAFCVILEQAVETVLRLKDDLSLLAGPNEDQFLVRIPSARDGAWEDAYLFAEPYDPSPITVDINDERLANIASSAERTSDVWEIDYCYLNAVVKEGKRHFFPLTITIVDHSNGIVVASEAAAYPDLPGCLVNKVVRLLDNYATLPRSILVRRPEAGLLLTPVAEALGIDLMLVDRLPETRQVQAALREHMA